MRAHCRSGKCVDRTAAKPSAFASRGDDTVGERPARFGDIAKSRPPHEWPDLVEPRWSRYDVTPLTRHRRSLILATST